MRTVIIDDKKTTRNKLRKLLEIYVPNSEVVAEAGGVETGYQCIKKNEPVWFY